MFEPIQPGTRTTLHLPPLLAIQENPGQVKAGSSLTGSSPGCPGAPPGLLPGLIIIGQ